MERTRLKQYRVGKKMTQAEFAKTLGYSRGQYARIENGEQDVTINFLQALEQAFGIGIIKAKELTKRDNERKE